MELTLFHEISHALAFRKKSIFTRSKIGREYKAHNEEREYYLQKPFSVQEFIKEIWTPFYQQVRTLP